MLTKGVLGRLDQDPKRVSICLHFVPGLKTTYNLILKYEKLIYYYLGLLHTMHFIECLGLKLGYLIISMFTLTFFI